MDNKLIKNSALNNSIRNGDNFLQNNDNYDPKQVDTCDINQEIITSHTSTITPQNAMLGGIFATQNFSYQTILVWNRSPLILTV